MSKETVTQTTFERSAVIFMAVVCAISLVAITGWLFNLPILASLRPEFLPMAPSTALIFLGLCGTWFMHRNLSTRRGMRNLVQAGLVGMLVILLIINNRSLTGHGPDLEQWLYPSPPLFGEIPSGRMSPLVAIGFFLAMAAFLLMSGGKPGQRTKSAAADLSLVVFILSSLIILGYLFGAPPFYGGSLIPVAITSAISFWFLSLGLLMTAGPSCWPVRMYVGPTLKARLMRAFIPASILIVLIQGLFSSTADPWIINPSLKVAVAALAAFLIVFLIISLTANNLSADIERGRQAEEALVVERNMLHTLIDNLPDNVFVKDVDSRIIVDNIAHRRLLGATSLEQAVGKTDFDFFSQELAASFYADEKQIIRSGESLINREEHVVDKDRNQRWLLTTKVPLRDPRGMVTGIVGINHDITERKQAEEALRQSEAELRALFASMRDVVLVIDRDGVYREIAPTNPKLLVKLPEELLGKTLRDVFPPEQAETFLRVVQQVLETKQTAQIEYDLIISDQTVRFETSISPMTEDSTLWVGRDITERKRAEEAQQQSEFLFRALFEASPDAVMLMDPHDPNVSWPIMDCNAVACVMNGYRQDELIGHSIDIVNMTPGAQAEQIAYLKQLREAGNLKLETFHRHKNGTIFPIEVSTTLIKVGERELVMGIDRDITERKQAEQLLRESENRFRAIFEQAAIGVAQINSRTGEFVRVNQKYCEIFGYSREEMLRLRFQEISHPDDLPGDLEQMQKLLDGEIHSFTMEKRHIRSDQSIIWLNLTVSPLWVPGEQPDYHMAVIEDITGRKRAEQELFKLNMAVDDSREAIFMTDREGVITFVNPGFTRLYGYTSDEIVGKTTPRILKSGVMKQEDYAAYWQTLLNKQVVNGELTNKTKDGRLLYIEGSANPILNEQEEIIGFLAIQRDITERKHMEKEIRNLSLIDELTGLYNRRGFTLLAEQEMKLARRFKRNVLLFFGDVDNLKTINDTWGHALGDLALVEVAAILKATFREADIPARFGGDEFVILAPDSSMESADVLTNRLQTALEVRNRQGDLPYQLSLSMGIAHFDPEAPCTVSELIAQADDMMYRKKQAGKRKKKVR